ncbi:MAG: response regulator, partial [Myxococcaceae bacterium]|nr:response regulator [Myxococcaceae bacterium]
MSDQVDILLVDDQAAGLLSLEATLEPLGQRLHRAQSGREALRALLDRDFALILLDVVMPGLDGFETARLIRERERSAETPIIFLTGLSETGLPRLRAYSMGAVDYLVKPYEPEVLRSKVSVFVDLARKSATI